jgi:DNA polymerase III delta prime subunit
MENLNSIFDRNSIASDIKRLLFEFDTRSTDISYKKGIYIYGSPGCGKTQFIMELLSDIDYDAVKYDTSDVRNKSMVNSITSNSISNHNVLHLMSNRKNKIAIVMDEIDGMNNGDKGGITALIKVIRQKKTKKQKLENTSTSPIICIGNYYIDKKIRELMKVCNVFELKTPTTTQIDRLLEYNIPNYNLLSQYNINVILKYIQGDLCKCAFVYDVICNNLDLLNNENLLDIFNEKQYDEDSKKITQTLFTHNADFQSHEKYMNETDRTIVALLWHENIIDILSKHNNSISFPLYYKILKTICFSDYIDRITFQKQIWQFNEMSSLIKTFYTNNIYHNYFKDNTKQNYLPDIRFTKVLTKYSTEYNNTQFIYYLSQMLDLDKRDILAMFVEYRLFNTYNTVDPMGDINTNIAIFDKYNISSLEIKRIYRFIDKNVKNDPNTTAELCNMDDDVN